MIPFFFAASIGTRKLAKDKILTILTHQLLYVMSLILKNL